MNLKALSMILVLLGMIRIGYAQGKEIYVKGTNKSAKEARKQLANNPCFKLAEHSQNATVILGVTEQYKFGLSTLGGGTGISMSLIDKQNNVLWEKATNRALTGHLRRSQAVRSLLDDMKKAICR